jgi:thiazole synthase ThiGH ThiG subunit
MAHGSVSAPSMLLGMTAVLANGTVARLTPAAYPALWRAFAVSAGRLG